MVTINFRRKWSGVPVLTKYEIDTVAEILLQDYNPQVLYEPGALDIEHFCENYVGLEMDYQDLSHNQSILGMMVFSDCLVPVYDVDRKEAKYVKANAGTVLIDNGLLGPEQIRRGRFTVGHEVGHWLLHKNKYKSNQGSPSSLDSGNSGTGTFIKCRAVDVGNRRRFICDNDWLEWQADYMSSALLMPRTTFAQVVRKEFQGVGINGYYQRGSNIALDLWVGFLAYQLADMFQVSVTAARIRLENLRFVRQPAQNQRLYPG